MLQKQNVRCPFAKLSRASHDKRQMCNNKTRMHGSSMLLRAT